MSTNRNNRFWNIVLSTSVAVLAGAGSQTSHAVAAYGTVDLLAAPPELTASVAPNLVLTLDDSGSMAFDYMPDKRPYDGSGWGNPYKCAAVIDPRITDSANGRSLPMNGVYYNPNTTYGVPIKADGVTGFPTPTFTSAWNDGIEYNRPNRPSTGGGTANLSSASFCGKTGAGYFRYKTGSPDLTIDVTSGAISNTSTLYTSGNWEWITLPAAEQTNFAIWYSYYRTRTNSAITAISRAYAPFDENVRVAWQNLGNNTGLDTDGDGVGDGPTIGNSTGIYKFKDVPAVYNTRTEFYKWLFKIPASNGTPNQSATQRVGNFFKRSTANSDLNPYWDRDLNLELSCRQNFHILMTDGLWNGSTVTTTINDNNFSGTLPDGRSYSTSATQSRVFWNETDTAKTQKTMADLGFQYWATDLRPDFQAVTAQKLKVPPFLPDKTTSLFGPALVPGANPMNNAEIYWNPANDPATWPHLVQFPIGFGVSGTLARNSATLLKLRTDDSVQWPEMQGSSPYTDTAEKIDDMWHMALNSRGEFFAAANPDELIKALNDIVTSITARRGASTAATAASSVLSAGGEGYKAGYDSTDWSGFATKHSLLLTGELVDPPLWDAGCILTGGVCPSNAPASATPRNPDNRVILTSDGVAGSGKPFRWGNLSSSQQAKLSANPSTVNLLSTPLPTYTSDGFGSQRVDYYRGNRTNETSIAPLPVFRKRTSVLGAVINGQPTFVSSPKAGWRNIWPTGSPEATGQLYSEFQANNAARRQIMYVAANDGMLHAFDGVNGSERWAYVPNMVIDNFHLTLGSRPAAGLVSTVDDPPLEQDVYFGGRWHTVLVGSMRLGARGVYALDVTDPITVAEGGTQTVPLWEFSNVAPAASPGTDCAVGARFCSSLGYTYGSVNIARLATSNKWVALVSSGYFPTDTLDPASLSAAAGATSLLVIDLETGRLIRELKTSSAPQFVAGSTKTFGLSGSLVYDFGSDQIDDVAVAGDLAGNLWRFDISDPNPSLWKVDLMFTSYGNGGAAAVGDQPFASMPVALSDPATARPIYIIGTGKLLGRPDRTNAIPQQAFYGLRDYGTNPAGGKYPIKVSQLQSQTLTQDSSGVRSLTRNTVSSTQAGWRIPLNVTAEPGERSAKRAFPLYSSNLAILYTVIPKGDDPCNPGNRYGLMIVGGAAGGAPQTTSTTYANLTGLVAGSPTPIADPTVSVGGKIVIPGFPPNSPPLPLGVLEALDDILEAASTLWHRGEWRELLQNE